MSKLTNRNWDKLWNQQLERDAEKRERIRQAVAASDAPLPADLVQAITNLNDKYVREVLRDHRGFALAERRDSYSTSRAIMEQCLQDLLVAIDEFKIAALADDSTLFNSSDDELQRFERKIQKELFACANAAASLVDHARRVDKCHAILNYTSRRTAYFGTDGLHEFVIALRVMLHHLNILDAGWNMTADFSKGTKSATFMISKATMQRIIRASPERFERKADIAMLAYVSAAPENIDLRTIFLDYQERMTKFHNWMKSELESESLIALRDYDRILKGKANADQLMFWKAMMGNWLNWNNPPDPHKHLSNFLSPAQIEEVNALPRNSREQANLVIRFIDKDGAIDDALRQQAYALFERSQKSINTPLPESS